MKPFNVNNSKQLGRFLLASSDHPIKFMSKVAQNRSRKDRNLSFHDTRRYWMTQYIFIFNYWRNTGNGLGSGISMGHTRVIAKFYNQNIQRDQIGRILKFLDTNCLKRKPKHILSCFDKHHFLNRTDVANSWAMSVTIWAAFYSNIWSHWLNQIHFVFVVILM